METILSPRVVVQGDEPKLSFFGAHTWVKATSEDTGGAYGLIEHVIAPGDASPWHLHHAEDESFYVIEGMMTFGVGEARFTIGAGGYVFAPRGIPHGFRNAGSTDARLLLMATPGGFERFVQALAVPMEQIIKGDSQSGPPDMGQLIPVAAQYHIEILGPFVD